jgi:hypothetical protein
MKWPAEGGALPPQPPGVPVVEMSTARPAVFALANAPAMNDAQVGAAITQFARLSDRPPPELAIRLARTERHLLDRPWIWLATVMKQAGNSGDHHLAAAGLFWASHWTCILVPKIGDDAASFMELELDPIPAAVKKEILALGAASVSQLPEDFVVAETTLGRCVLARFQN